MKKNISLVFALLFLGASLVPLGFASRDVYHNYLVKKSSEESLRTDKKIYHPFEKIVKEKITERKYIRNTMRRDLNVYKKESKKEEVIYNTDYYRGSFRRSGNRVSSTWTSGLQKRDAVVFKKISNAIKVFDSYQNDSFIVQIPRGWKEIKEERKGHFFVNPKSEYTISIKKFSGCETVSFTTCAILISTNENRDHIDGRISPSSTITRQSQFFNTIRGSRIQTRTLMEGFSSILNGKESYISRFFVADLDGGIYVIETKSLLKNAPNFIGVSKAIFDSFRIVPSEEFILPPSKTETGTGSTITPAPSLETEQE